MGWPEFKGSYQDKSLLQNNTVDGVMPMTINCVIIAKIDSTTLHKQTSFQK